MKSRVAQSWAVGDHDLRFTDEMMKSLNIALIAFRHLGALSCGQREVVSIAQALVREPEIMLMDEPTSALDLHRQVEVLHFMHTQARTKGMIVLIAIHDLNRALRFADKVLVIGNGRVSTDACRKHPWLRFRSLSNLTDNGTSFLKGL